MKVKSIFLTIIVIILCVGKIYSQIVPIIQKTTLSNNDKAIIDQRLTEYTSFTMDKGELINTLHREKAGQFKLLIDENLKWTISLELNDMRAPDYRQIPLVRICNPYQFITHK
jgi:hypothetical protein